MIKSLDEWAEARVQHDHLEETMPWNDVKGPGYAYEGGYIEGPANGLYYLLIGNKDWSSTSLERLEGLLYELWAKPEVLLG